jgi:hypothetical protein
VATRLYLIPGSTPSISPAFAAAWNQTTGAIRRLMSPATEPVPPSTASETRTQSESSATSPFDVLLAQLISPPLSGAQTLGDGGATLKGRIRAFEADADADYRAQLVAYVVSSDGGTVRGTLLALDASALASEFAVNALTARKFPLGSPATLSSVAASDLDRIVVEVGYRSHNSHATARNAQIELRQGAASDLAEDETGTGADNPWLEFSEDVAFVNEVDVTTQVVETAAADPDTDVSATTLVVEPAATTAARDVGLSTMVVEVATSEDLAYWDVLLEGDF